jgi:hypothetical protein
MRASVLALALVASASLTACAGARPTTRPEPESPAVLPAATVLTDSASFQRLVDAYLAGAPRERADTLAWLRGYELAAERRGALRSDSLLRALRALDTTRLGVSQRIDWLLLESWLTRTVHDTLLHLPARMPGRYLTLGDVYWRIADDRPLGTDAWLDIRRDLRRAPRVMALGRSQLSAPPPLWVDLALATARSYESFLGEEFIRRAAAAPDSLRPSVLEAAAMAQGALRAYAAFLRDTLVPGPASSWAAGEAWYDWVLRESNFLPYGAAEMIAEGRRVHAATRLALDSLAGSLRPGTPWRTLVAEMQTRHPEAGAVTEAYRRASRRVLALLIRDDLVRIPPCEELAFFPTPPQLRETYAWGGYSGITVRDSVAVGRFFVTDVVPTMTPQQVEEKLRTQNHGWISVIALHEGYPGHHLQHVYTRRNPSRLRQHGGNTYFGEGWALYAEHWMARAGLFADDPDGRLGQLQMRLWRTARVVIDPLHTGRMSYEEAVRFFMDEVGLERSAAEAEVNRFTTWPTQAPSYIIGWLELERLKAELQQALGPRFSERDFIERVLAAGPLPLALLRRAVLYSYGLGA